MMRIGLLLVFLLGSLVTKGQSTVSHPQEGPKVIVEMPESLRNVLHLYQAKAKKYPQISGYRIQIFNGRKDDCLDKRSKFLRTYPDMPAYLLYEVPEYKTQIGNFRNRLEAEAFLQKIIGDFPGSFVLATKIEKPRF